MTSTQQYASPVDTTTYGAYRIIREADDPRPLYRFTGRVSANGHSGFKAEPGRYHLYAGWFCPWAQRVTIEIALNGLQDVVSVSYVDGARDGRGWGFREQYGPDPINGFTLLRDAYDRTEPGFDGHVSVPTLWDRQRETIVSNDYTLIGIDLATQFRPWSTPGIDTYPLSLRKKIEDLDRWIGPSVNQGVNRAKGSGVEAADARAGLLASFTALEELLSAERYLLGNTVTEADIRLYVTLVRYDVQANAERQIGPPLSAYPNLASYAADLYAIPAFRDTTDFSAFSAAGTRPSFLNNQGSLTDG